MKLEIYQVGKVPPLTVVECDVWELILDNFPRIMCTNSKNQIVAEFFINNIAGFKEVGDNK